MLRERMMLQFMLKKRISMLFIIKAVDIQVCILMYQIILLIRNCNNLNIIQWSLGLRCHRLTILLPGGPIVSISDTFSINDMFMISHGPQFQPIGALLGGLSRPQPITDPFYEPLELGWLAFQCLMCVAFNMYFLCSINDNFN
jgi:hypothetical protein